jgi:hypothetical protein
MSAYTIVNISCQDDFQRAHSSITELETLPVNVYQKVIQLQI